MYRGDAVLLEEDEINRTEVASCCCPSQTSVYGISVLSFFIGCVWGLRWLSEVTVPWLMQTSYSRSDCLTYALWCVATLAVCVLYLYSAEITWAAASDLDAASARKGRVVLWAAFAAAAAKLTAVLAVIALSEVALGANPYEQLERQIFMSMVVGTMIVLLAVTLGMAHMLTKFARECTSAHLACLA